MKHIQFASSVLLALALSASAQVRLNPGHTLTYEFTSLPYERSVRLGVTDIRAPRATVYFESAAGPSRGVRLQVEMFEDSVSETPICSQIYIAPYAHDDAGEYEFRCRVENAWQDFQGAVRLTMLSGSLVFRSITFEVLTIDPPEVEDRDVNYYLLVVPLQTPR